MADWMGNNGCVNHGMCKNTKSRISWERNIIYLQNKKTHNLCFIWHTLRSYRFVAEVTFNRLCDSAVARILDLPLKSVDKLR